jgi:hypothetical protein
MTDFQRVDLDDNWAFVRGAARLLICDTTMSFPEQINDVINLASGAQQYDVKEGWEDLGATKSGIQISTSVDEETISLDLDGSINPQPTKNSCRVRTELAEMTMERIRLVWNGSDIENAISPLYPEEELYPEEDLFLGDSEDDSSRQVGVGTPHRRESKRLAVLFKSPNTGLIRAFVFRKVEISGSEASMEFNKVGSQQTLPIEFIAAPDFAQTDIKSRFFLIFEQIGDDTQEEVFTFGSGQFGG